MQLDQLDLKNAPPRFRAAMEGRDPEYLALIFEAVALVDLAAAGDDELELLAPADGEAF